MGAVIGGLKLTRAAILALLKKKRKALQIWEAKKSTSMGIAERSHLRRDPHIRARMGKKEIKRGLGPMEIQLGDLMGQTAPMKRAKNILAGRMAAKRRKVTSAVKKGRKKGIKLSEYKSPNPVYQTVSRLRKFQAKTRKKSEAPTLFNYPR